MSFGNKVREQWERVQRYFRTRNFQNPFKMDTGAFRAKFQAIDWRKMFDVRRWKIDRAKLNSWRDSWKSHLENLPNTLSQLPNKIPQDFRINTNTLIYINCAAIAICSYFAADLIATILTPFLPEPPARRVVIKRRQPTDISQYEVIVSRNLFNKDGIIPASDAGDVNGVPVKTSLPLELMGIILLQDKLKSVASVNDRSKNDVIAVKVNDPINAQAIVQEIAEDRVIFINRQTNRREYIELPDDVKKLKTRIISAPGAKADGVTRIDETHMTVDRSEVDKALANLNTVLTQARCVPNMENGKSAGFRCFQIVKGSIYDKIGMQDGDVILGINGTELLDPGQAFELFNQLKTASSIDLSIKRRNQTLNLQYDIQ